MIKKLDCKNLPCPEPVLKTKEAWENLSEDSILDIELNSISSIENVKRFARSQGIYFQVKEKSKELTVISLVKGYECQLNENDNKKFYTIIFGSIISAILASWYDYFKERKKPVCDTSLCKNYKLYLIIGTIFVAIMITYPYWIGYLLEKL